MCIDYSHPVVLANSGCELSQSKHGRTIAWIGKLFILCAMEYDDLVTARKRCRLCIDRDPDMLRNG